MPRRDGRWILGRSRIDCQDAGNYEEQQLGSESRSVTERYWNGHLRWVLKSCRNLRVNYKNGTDSTPFHKVYIILEGEMTIATEDGEVVLRPLDFVEPRAQ